MFRCSFLQFRFESHTHTHTPRPPVAIGKRPLICWASRCACLKEIPAPCQKKRHPTNYFSFFLKKRRRKKEEEQKHTTGCLEQPMPSSSTSTEPQRLLRFRALPAAWRLPLEPPPGPQVSPESVGVVLFATGRTPKPWVRWVFASHRTGHTDLLGFGAFSFFPPPPNKLLRRTDTYRKGKRDSKGQVSLGGLDLGVGDFEPLLVVENKWVPH